MPAKGRKRAAKKLGEPSASASGVESEKGVKEKDTNLLSSPKSTKETREITSYFAKSPSPVKHDERSQTTITQGESKTSSTALKNPTDPEKDAKSSKSTGDPPSDKAPLTATTSDNQETVKDYDRKSTSESKKPMEKYLLKSPGDISIVDNKKKTKKKKETKTSERPTQTAITEHFRVRRSQRKCKSAVEEEKQQNIEKAVLLGLEEGLEICDVEGKGRGVFAVKYFNRGDFVCEYAGELIDYNTAKEREQKYSEKAEVGCYMYYFSFKNKKYCVDATKESGRLGRLLNHSVHGNCTTKLISIKGNPYLILVTSQDIKPGEELLYDYGERSKDIIESHPWLKA